MCVCSVHEAKCPDTTYISTQNSEPARFKFTQVMNSSEKSSPVDSPDYYSTPYSWMIDSDFRHIEPEEDEVIFKLIPEIFHDVSNRYSDIELARMAAPANQHDDMSGLQTVDCGATTTITIEFLKTSNVKPKVATIQMAMDSNNEMHLCRHKDMLCF